MSSDLTYMRQALDLARKAEGQTSPNPAVGALVVREGTVIGRGVHVQVGAPHAEVVALQQADTRSLGATMYVTLEPCNHTGATPPCTEAIIDAGIQRLVYAARDPNPHVHGGGHERLAEAGLNVTGGILEDQALQLNRFYVFAVRTGMPYVVAKFASSLDGRIATRSGESKWITGSRARIEGHRLRRVVDAVMVGADTAILDDPELTAREDARMKAPLRIVCDSAGRVPLDRKMFRRKHPGKTLVATTSAMPDRHIQSLESLGVDVLVCVATENGRVDPEDLLRHLGARRIQSVLIEGGGVLLGSFFDLGLVNEVWAMLAPLVIGGRDAAPAVAGRGAARLADVPRFETTEVRKVGHDVIIIGQRRPQS
jgi:diaminohydroxyphosphoribosylaminopyrimidine deaminase/5-amino-6-(5-phosphoribosylamino)uracil reductase